MDGMVQPAPFAMLRDPAQVEALLQPLRRRLVEELQRPDSAAGLARRLDLPRQQVNYHLRELESAGLAVLVEERRRGNFVERVMGASARRYVISPEVLGSLGDDAEASGDHFSSAFLVAEAARTIRELASLRERADAAGERLATMTLTTVVQFASAEKRNAFARELTDSVARLVQRYHDANASGGRRFRLLLGAYPSPQSARDGEDGIGDES
jgi:DNA-binding transcriptional ArsR family regulator